MKSSTEEIIALTPRQAEAIVTNPAKGLQAVDLIYVSDTVPGIKRMRKGKGFIYLSNGKKLSDKEHLNRIKALAIPPAWTNVWICELPQGHLQATGIDALKRKQYKYHPTWTKLRNQTKFFRLYEFGNTLPHIRKRLELDLAKKGLPKEKVLALVVKLMELTNIRIGNSAYEKLYGSFGLTTLKDKHVKIGGNKAEFSFKGKKGIEHKISIRSKQFIKLIKQCRDIPGRDLFQYMDENGVPHAIDSGAVNSYLKEISGKDFTAKDFRTWSGTISALTALKDLPKPETEAETQRKIVEVLNEVSSLLGNSRAICKKYYVHPNILKMYENDTLSNYLSKWNIKRVKQNGLSSEEHLLISLLKKAGT